MLAGRLAAAALAAVLFVAALPVAPAAAQVLTAVEWADTQPGAGPVPGAQWMVRALPLQWEATGRDQLRGVALRMRFHIAERPQEAWALLLAKVSTGGRFYLNGHMIGDIPATSETLDAHWRRARMLAINPASLVNGDNTILLLTTYRDGTHALAGFEVGPMAELSARHEHLLFLTSALPWINAVIAAMLAVIFGVMWWRRRRMTLALLTLGAAAWALRSVLLTFNTSAATAFVWAAPTVYLATGIFAATQICALLRSAGRREMRDFWLLLGYAFLGPALLAAGDRPALAWVDGWWLPGLIGIALAAFAFSIRLRRRLQVAPRYGMHAAIVATLGASCHDYAALRGWLPPGHLQALDWAVPLLLMTLAAPLIDRYLRVLRVVETARSDLEGQVHEREQMLKHSFEQLRKDERRQAVMAERQRIMQDMHDGLGSQLLSSLMLVERGALSQIEVADVLRDCIDDMRLAIDALAQRDTDFVSAVGNLRYRMEPRFRAVGIALKWDVARLPDELDLDTGAILPILRIVQEALTNALKHSHARNVVVSMDLDSSGDVPALLIRVSDNGRGITGEKPGTRGLQGMRQRAEKIGAEFMLESTAGSGTRVRLKYPITQAPDSAPTTANIDDVDTNAVIEHFRAN